MTEPPHGLLWLEAASLCYVIEAASFILRRSFVEPVVALNYRMSLSYCQCQPNSHVESGPRTTDKTTKLIIIHHDWAGLIWWNPAGKSAPTAGLFTMAHQVITVKIPGVHLNQCTSTVVVPGHSNCLHPLQIQALTGGENHGNEIVYLGSIGFSEAFDSQTSIAMAQI